MSTQNNRADEISIAERLRDQSLHNSSDVTDLELAISLMDSRKDNPLKRYLIWVGCIVLLGGLLVMLSFLIMKKNNIDLFDYVRGHIGFLEKMASRQFPFFIFFIFIFTLVDFALLLPLYVVSYIIFAFLIADLMKSIVILTIIPVLASVSLYFIADRSLRVSIDAYFEKFPFLRLMAPRTTSEHFINAFLLRFIYAPIGLKEYVLSCFQFRLDAVVASGIFFFGLHAVILSMIGVKLDGVNQNFSSVPWSEKSKAEKFEMVFVVFAIVLTVLLFVLLPWYAMKKFEQVEKKKLRRLRTMSVHEEKEALIMKRKETI